MSNHKWLYEDELPDDYDYDQGYLDSKVEDGVRIFPPESDLTDELHDRFEDDDPRGF